jgi:hypothetical protein
MSVRVYSVLTLSFVDSGLATGLITRGGGGGGSGSSSRK